MARECGFNLYTVWEEEPEGAERMAWGLIPSFSASMSLNCSQVTFLVISPVENYARCVYHTCEENMQQVFPVR